MEHILHFNHRIMVATMQVPFSAYTKTAHGLQDALLSLSTVSIGMTAIGSCYIIGSNKCAVREGKRSM